MISKSVQDRTDRFAVALNSAAPAGYHYSVEPGPRYLRVVAIDRSGERRIHLWVDGLTGERYRD